MLRAARSDALRFGQKCQASLAEDASIRFVWHDVITVRRSFVDHLLVMMMVVAAAVVVVVVVVVAAAVMMTVMLIIVIAVVSPVRLLSVYADSIVVNSRGCG